MYYSQPLLQTPSNHYSSPPRSLPNDFNQPRIHPQFNPEPSNLLKPNPYAHGLYGLQPKYVPSVQSMSELPTPYISQQQKTALQTLSKNMGPDYVFPTLPKSPLRAKFNPSLDSPLTEQPSPLKKKLTLDFNSNSARTKTLPSLNDNDYNNEGIYSRSPVNPYPDIGYTRQNTGHDLLLPKTKSNKIPGLEYRKHGIARSEKFDDVEISPRLENNKPFYIPQKTEPDRKVNNNGSPASFERSLTLDTEDYILPKDTNRLIVGYSPYAESNSKSPQLKEQTVKRRPPGPVSLTSLVQSPSAPLASGKNNDMYYLKASLGIAKQTTEPKADDEPSINRNLGSQNQESPRTAVKIERRYRKATTMANLKPFRTEPDEGDEDINDISLENNLKRESEKAIQNMRIKRMQENLHMKKISGQKESQPEFYESPKKEFVIKDSKKNLKQMFSRQGTMEVKSSVGQTSEGVIQKMSPRSPREKLETKPKQKMEKMDIKIMGENGIKTKEIKMFPGELSEILEKNFNANESEGTDEDSEPVHYELNLVNILAGLDAEDDSNHSPRVARAKLTKGKQNKK